MKPVKPPAACVLPNNPASAKALSEFGEREFFARGVAAGTKARESGVTVSAAQSIARLRTLAAKHAASVIAGQRQ